MLEQSDIKKIEQSVEEFFNKTTIAVLSVDIKRSQVENIEKKE